MAIAVTIIISAVLVALVAGTQHSPARAGAYTGGDLLNVVGYRLLFLSMLALLVSGFAAGLAHTDPSQVLLPSIIGMTAAVPLIAIADTARRARRGLPILTTVGAMIIAVVAWIASMFAGLIVTFQIIVAANPPTEPPKDSAAVAAMASRGLGLAMTPFVVAGIIGILAFVICCIWVNRIRRRTPADAQLPQLQIFGRMTRRVRDDEDQPEITATHKR